MTHAPKTGRLSAAQQVWGHLAHTSKSMLWIEGSRQDPQFLPHRAEPHRTSVWYHAPCALFTTPNIFDGAWAAMTVAAKDHSFFATIKGRVVRLRGSGHRDAKAGVDIRRCAEVATADAEHCVLCFTPHEAAVWAGGQERLIFGAPMIPNQPRPNHGGIGRGRRH